MICSVSSANCDDNCKKTSSPCAIEHEKENPCSKKKDECTSSSWQKENFTKDCDKYLIENDDEYCIYNQCYFDKQYRKMKNHLCLTKKQENCIDNIYRNFKIDMEILHSKYRIQKNKVLSMIDCEKNCSKDEIEYLKELKKDSKELLKDLKNEIQEQLCKEQKKKFKKFIKCERKKMKKIIKYAPVYKLPCSNCCKD